MTEREGGRWAGFVDALRHAMSGLHYAVRTQRTFRLQIICAAVIVGLTVWLRLPPVEAAVIVLAMGGVLAAELFNTGVEAIVDLLVERNHHRAAKIAKDIAAAAVVVSVVGAILAGGIILGPALTSRLGVPPAWGPRLAWLGVAVVLLAVAVALLIFLRRPAPGEGPRKSGAAGARSRAHLR